MNNYKVIFFFLFFFYGNYYYCGGDVNVPHYQFESDDDGYEPYGPYQYGKSQNPSFFLNTSTEYKKTFYETSKTADKLQNNRSQQSKTSQEAQTQLGEIQMREAVQQITDDKSLKDSLILPQDDSFLIFAKNLIQFISEKFPEVINGFLNVQTQEINFAVSYLEYFMSSFRLGNKNFNMPLGYAWTSVIKSNPITITSNWNISVQLIVIKPQEEFKANKTQLIGRFTVIKRLKRKILFDDIHVSAHWGTYQNGHIMGVQGFTILAGGFHGIIHCSFKKNVNQQYVILGFNLYVSFIFTKISLYFVVDINQLKQIIKQIQPHFALEINLWAKTKRDKKYMEEFDIHGFNSILGDIAEIKPNISNGKNFLRTIAQKAIADNDKVIMAQAMEIITQSEKKPGEYINYVNLKKDEWKKVEPILNILKVLINFDEEKFLEAFNKNKEDLENNYQNLMDIKEIIIDNEKNNKVDIHQFQQYELVFKKIQNNFHLIKQTIKDNIGTEVNLKKAELFFNHLLNNLFEHTNEIIPIYKKQNIHLSNEVPNLEEERFKDILNYFNQINNQIGKGKSEKKQQKKQQITFNETQEKRIQESEKQVIEIDNSKTNTLSLMLQMCSFWIKKKLSDSSFPFDQTLVSTNLQRILSKISESNPVSFNSTLIEEIIAKDIKFDSLKKAWNKTADDLIGNCESVNDVQSQTYLKNFYLNLKKWASGFILYNSSGEVQLDNELIKQYKYLLTSYRKNCTINDGYLLYGLFLSKLYKEMGLVDKKVTYIKDDIFNVANLQTDSRGQYFNFHPDVVKFFTDKLKVDSPLGGEGIPINVFCVVKDVEIYDKDNFDVKIRKTFNMDYETFLKGMNERNEERRLLSPNFDGLNPKQGSGTFEFKNNNIKFSEPVPLQASDIQEIFTNNTKRSFVDVWENFITLKPLKQKGCLIDMQNKIYLYCVYNKYSSLEDALIKSKNNNNEKSFKEYINFFYYLYEYCSITNNIDLIQKLKDQNNKLNNIEQNILNEKVNRVINIVIKDLARSRLYCENFTQNPGQITMDNYIKIYQKIKADFVESPDKENFFSQTSPTLINLKQYLKQKIEKIDTNLNLEQIEENFNNNLYKTKDDNSITLDPKYDNLMANNWKQYDIDKRNKDILSLEEHIRDIRNQHFKIDHLFVSLDDPIDPDGWKNRVFEITMGLSNKEYTDLFSTSINSQTKEKFLLVEGYYEKREVKQYWVQLAKQCNLNFFPRMQYLGTKLSEYFDQQFYLNRFINMKEFVENEIGENMENFYQSIKNHKKIFTQEIVTKDNNFKLIKNIESKIQSLSGCGQIISQKLNGDEITEHIMKYKSTSDGKTIDDLWTSVQENKSILDLFFCHMETLGKALESKITDIEQKFQEIENILNTDIEQNFQENENILNNLPNKIHKELSNTYQIFYNKQLKTDHDEYQQTKKDLQINYNINKQLNNNLSKLIKDESVKKKQLTMLENNFSTLEIQIKNKEQALKSNSQNINDIQKEIKELNTQLNLKKSQHNKLSTEMENQTREIETKKLEKKTIEDNIDDLEKKKQRLNDQLKNNKNNIKNFYDEAKNTIINDLKIEEKITQINKLLNEMFIFTNTQVYNPNLTQEVRQSLDSLIQEYIKIFQSQSIDNLQTSYNGIKIDLINQIKDHKKKEENIIATLTMDNIKTFKMGDIEIDSIFFRVYAKENFNDSNLKWKNKNNITIFDIDETYQQNRNKDNNKDFFASKKKFSEVKIDINKHTLIFTKLNKNINENYNFLQSQLINTINIKNEDILHYRNQKEKEELEEKTETVKAKKEQLKMKRNNKKETTNNKIDYLLNQNLKIQLPEKLKETINENYKAKDANSDNKIRQAIQETNKIVFNKIFDSFVYGVKYQILNDFQLYMKPKIENGPFFHIMDNSDSTILNGFSNNINTNEINPIYYINNWFHLEDFPLQSSSFLPPNECIKKIIDFSYIKITQQEKKDDDSLICLFEHDLMKIKKIKPKEFQETRDLHKKQEFHLLSPDGLITIEKEASDINAPLLIQKILTTDQTIKPIIDLKTIINLSNQELLTYLNSLYNLFLKDDEKDPEATLDEKEKLLKILPLYPNFSEDDQKIIKDKLEEYIDNLNEKINNNSERENKEKESDKEKNLKNLKSKKEITELINSLSFLWPYATDYNRSLLARVANVNYSEGNSNDDIGTKIRSFLVNESVSLVKKYSNICSKVFGLGYDPQMENPIFNTLADILGYIFNFIKTPDNIVNSFFLSNTLYEKYTNETIPLDEDKFKNAISEYINKFKITEKNGNWILDNSSIDFRQPDEIKKFTEKITFDEWLNSLPNNIKNAPDKKIFILESLGFFLLYTGNEIGEKLLKNQSSYFSIMMDMAIKFIDSYRIGTEFAVSKRQETKEYAIAQSFSLKNSMEIVEFMPSDGLSIYTEDKNSSEPAAYLNKEIRKILKDYSFEGVVDLLFHFEKQSFNKNQEPFGPFGVFEKVMARFTYYEFFFEHMWIKNEDNDGELEKIQINFSKFLKIKKKAFDTMNSIKNKIIKGDDVAIEFGAFVKDFEEKLKDILEQNYKQFSSNDGFFKSEAGIVLDKIANIENDKLVSGENKKIDTAVLYSSDALKEKYFNYKNETNLKILLTLLTIEKTITRTNPQLARELFNKEMMDYIETAMGEITDSPTSVKIEKIPIIWTSLFSGFEIVDISTTSNNNQKYDKSKMTQPMKPIELEQQSRNFITLNLPQGTEKESTKLKINLFSEIQTPIEEDESFVELMNKPILIDQTNKQKFNLYSLSHLKPNGNSKTEIIDISNYFQILLNQISIQSDEARAFFSHCKKEAKEYNILESFATWNNTTWKPDYRIALKTLDYFVKKLEKGESASLVNFLLGFDRSHGVLQKFSNKLLQSQPKIINNDFVKTTGTEQLIELFNFYNRKAAASLLHLLANFAMIIQPMTDQEIKSISPLPKEEIIQRILGIFLDEDYSLNKEQYQKLKALCEKISGTTKD